MCGIAGSISHRIARPLDLKYIAHRGPDGEGEWESADKQVWFGHRRLAILDLSSTGTQPMIDPLSGNVIIFNGEIYNHLELRTELAQLGAVFVGTSDTETLLIGYRHWGEGLLSKLRGMFAFAIYDEKSRCVFLARDRLGIKPLYVIKQKDEFFFASEARILTKTIPCRPTLNSVANYLHWGSCTHQLLLYPEMSEFPVGSWMKISHDISVQKGVFWPPPSFSFSSNTEEISPARTVRKLLEESVEEHLLSDVPVACMLSGGIDSSIITAIAAQKSRRPIATFSVGFEMSRYDESHYAKMIAERYATEHHHIQLTESEVLEIVKEAVTNMDLPSVDAINTYIVSKTVAKAGYKVLLSGLGGDELFGGYPQFRMIPRFKYLAFAPEWFKNGLMLLGKGRHLLDEVPKKMDAGLFDLWWRRICNGNLLREIGLPTYPLPQEERPLLIDDFAKISWSELTHYMRDMLLRDSDQMTMAFSLELRVPFLDHRLVEYVLQLPASVKTNPLQTKGLLINAVRDLLPENIYNRKKQGFELPMQEWIRGPLKDYVYAGLDETVLTAGISASSINSLVDSFLSGRQHWTKIWSIATLGHFLKKENLSIDFGESKKHSAISVSLPSSAVSNPQATFQQKVHDKTYRRLSLLIPYFNKYAQFFFPKSYQNVSIIPIGAGLGDFIMATPFYRALENERGSKCIIFIVVSGWPVENLLSLYTFPKKVYRLNNSPSLLNLFALGVKLRSYKAKEFFLPFDGSPGWMYGLALLSAAKERIGHTYQILGHRESWASKSLTQPVSLRTGVSSSDLYIDLLQPCSGKNIEIEDRSLPVLSGDVLEQFQLKEGSYVVIQAGASHGNVSSKIWPWKSYKELIVLLQNANYDVVLVGSEVERKIADQISPVLRGNSKNMVGYTTLQDLLLLVEKSAGFVGHDSGVAHIADAYHKPYVIIFGPADYNRTRPVSPTGVILRNETLECIGCRSNFSRNEEEVIRDCKRAFECMTSITAKEAFEVFLKVMK